jgi:DNA-binding beta-propeller fold protein YncE
MRAIVSHVIGGLALGLLTLCCPPRAAAQYIYIANTAEATVSKIDINTNTEVARYRTWFGPPGPPTDQTYGNPLPSRIAVDANEDVFVLNRFFTKGAGSGLPVLVKILSAPGVNT